MSELAGEETRFTGMSEATRLLVETQSLDRQLAEVHSMTKEQLRVLFRPLEVYTGKPASFLREALKEAVRRQSQRADGVGPGGYAVASGLPGRYAASGVPITFHGRWRATLALDDNGRLSLQEGPFCRFGSARRGGASEELSRLLAESWDKRERQDEDGSALSACFLPPTETLTIFLWRRVGALLHKDEREGLLWTPVCQHEVVEACVRQLVKVQGLLCAYSDVELDISAVLCPATKRARERELEDLKGARMLCFERLRNNEPHFAMDDDGILTNLVSPRTQRFVSLSLMSLCRCLCAKF